MEIKTRLTNGSLLISALELAAGITAGKITDTFGKAFLGMTMPQGKKSKLIYKLGMVVIDFTVANYAMIYTEKILNDYKVECQEVVDHYNERKAEYEEEQYMEEE